MRVKSGCMDYNDDGWSMYQDPVLAANDLPRSSILDDPTWRIVGLTARELRGLDRKDGHSLDVTDNPWPDGANIGSAHQVAHALVTLKPETTRKFIDRWASFIIRHVNAILPDRQDVDPSC